MRFRGAGCFCWASFAELCQVMPCLRSAPFPWVWVAFGWALWLRFVHEDRLTGSKLAAGHGPWVLSRVGCFPCLLGGVAAGCSWVRFAALADGWMCPMTCVSLGFFWFFVFHYVSLYFFQKVYYTCSFTTSLYILYLLSILALLVVVY